MPSPDRDDASRLRFFEIYADEAAYDAHLESPHFRKYRMTTDPMVRSRTLTDTIPIQLTSKMDW